MAVMLISMTSVFAYYEQVHVEDENGIAMAGVGVNLSSDCGWGPETDDTDAIGFTMAWEVTDYCTYTATVPTPPPGYTCDSGSDYNDNEMVSEDKIRLQCTPTEVPEFGLLAGCAAIIGTLVGFVYLRKR